MTVIIGAGLAGLVAAQVLRERGIDFLILEAGDAVGGRVRTDVVDGFTFDRGFQVLLDSYPSVRKFLDLPALQPRYFDSGALLHDDEGFFRLMHPVRHPAWFGSSALTPAFGWGDKIAAAALVASCVLHSDAMLLERARTGPDESTRELLRRLKFSETFQRRFIEPFFGGVFLDGSLDTSASLFRYYLKMFAVGRALVPAAGMGAIPEQLAGRLPKDRIRFGTRIASLEMSHGRASAVVAESGERFPAGQFILATDEPAACKLLGGAARAPRSVWTLWYRTRQSLYTGPLLVLPATRPGRRLTHLVQMTNVAPEVAPVPWHLVCATVIDAGGDDASTLPDRVLQEIGEIFSESRGNLEFLRIARTDYAQFDQRPGFPGLRPSPLMPSNVFAAGDRTGFSSIQCAMASGEAAALAIPAR
jgi:protoporphyrinogen oxidase